MLSQLPARGGIFITVTLLLFNAWDIQATINVGICLENIPQPQAKSFPNVPNNFRADFAWNMMDVNTTFFVQEIFSDELNLGVMLIENLLGPGIRSKLYTYAQTNEYIYIPDYDGSYGGNCTVGKLSFNDFAFPFRVVGGKDKLVSGKDVLLMGAGSAVMSYMGTDTIDDIDVDVWNGCLYVKDTDMTMNATYYFTLNTTDENRWRTASGLASTIKRIHIKQDNSKGTAPSESTYEYVYFTDSIPIDNPNEMRIYEPPLGSYCEGRSDTKALPTVADFFSFNMEVYDPQQHLITFTDEWYDFTANLTRMDHNIQQDRSNISKPITVIHDYQTGLSYNIAKYTGKCVVTAILKDSFDNVIIPSAQDMVRMRNPKEFFDFDNPKYPWIYEGTHVERGVECEVWISKRPYPTEDSNMMAYWEWYFTNTQWVISNGDVLENLEPFRMVITVPDLNMQRTEFNVYNFNQEPPNDRYFDISECFDQHNESRSYEFVMRADVAKFKLDQNMGMLQYWTTTAIEMFAGLRSVRVHGVQFIFDVNKVYTRFTLLGKPKIKGDVASPVDDMSLEDAEQYLVSSIQAEKFLVYFLQQNGKETQFQVDKDSLVRMEYVRGANQSVYYVIDDDGSDDAQLTAIVPVAKTGSPIRKPADVSNAGVAGIAIVLLIVGLALVAVPFYFLSIRKKSLDSFNKTQLTMSEMRDE